MSKQANKTLVGAFVVGAAALAVAGVLIFGSGKFLTGTETYVMYFDGSVNGLNVGSSVVFRGVKIGSVTDIRITVDPSDLSFRTPVFIEVERNRFYAVGDLKQKRSQKEVVPLLIDRGLKAQLGLQSLVTGQLMVEIDFFPDKPINLEGGDSGYIEIPTVPTAIEELTRTLEKLPLDSMIDKFFSTLEAIEKIVNSPDAQEGMTSLNQTLKDVQGLVKNIDSRIEPLASGIEKAVDHTQRLMQDINLQVVSNIEETAKAAGAAAIRAEKAIAAIEGAIGEDSQTIYQLRQTLEDVSAAAHSLRLLSDYLERHPESLLRGKGKRKGE